MTVGFAQQTARVNIGDEHWRQFRILALESASLTLNRRGYGAAVGCLTGGLGSRDPVSQVLSQVS